MILRNSEQQILVRLILQNIIEYQITIKIIQNDLYIILLNAQILIPSPRNASSMTIILIELGTRFVRCHELVEKDIRKKGTF